MVLLYIVEFRSSSRIVLACKSMQKWLNDHRINLLTWPLLSSDWNPIEKLWGEMKIGEFTREDLKRILRGLFPGLLFYCSVFSTSINWEPLGHTCIIYIYILITLIFIKVANSYGTDSSRKKQNDQSVHKDNVKLVINFNKHAEF